MKDLLTVKESLNSPQESHTVLRLCHKTLSEFDLRHRFCLEYGNILGSGEDNTPTKRVPRWRIGERPVMG